MISASRQIQSLSNRCQNPVLSTAARSRATSSRPRSGSLKKGRPVRVYTTPVSPSPAPNLRRAAASSRQSRITARDPMCFSWQITLETPWPR